MRVTRSWKPFGSVARRLTCSSRRTRVPLVEAGANIFAGDRRMHLEDRTERRGKSHRALHLGKQWRVGKNRKPFGFRAPVYLIDGGLIHGFETDRADTAAILAQISDIAISRIGRDQDRAGIADG